MMLMQHCSWWKVKVKGASPDEEGPSGLVPAAYVELVRILGLISNYITHMALLSSIPALRDVDIAHIALLIVSLSSAIPRYAVITVPASLSFRGHGHHPALSTIAHTYFISLDVLYYQNSCHIVAGAAHNRGQGAIRIRRAGQWRNQHRRGPDPACLRSGGGRVVACSDGGW